MAIPFASLETRVNAATNKHLANRTLKINYVDVDGQFDNGYEEAGFTESSNPTFETLTSNLVDVEHKTLVLDDATGEEWEVIGIENDGTGMTKLELRVKWYS